MYLYINFYHNIRLNEENTTPPIVMDCRVMVDESGWSKYFPGKRWKPRIS